ncbi:MAG: single-stranded DNA-binding protein, partial [Pseudanabaena sp. RU_4_16]|nr:single-stranded DNA-binding protein [Pseudanabaena sp. RU_4_16]
RTIAERGVQLVGTAHGNQLANLIKNPTLSDLVGGIQSVTLGDEEARRRGTQKSILERKAPPTFNIAVEMLERYRWIVHQDVSETIDGLLRGREPAYQIRAVNEEGQVTIAEEQPRQPEIVRNPGARGWRVSGRMEPLPIDRSLVRNGVDLSTGNYGSSGSNSESSISRSESRADRGDRLEEKPVPRAIINAGAITDKDTDVVYVYLYAVSRQQSEQVIDMLRLPVILTKDLDSADMVLALRSQVRSHSKLRHLAETHSLPIHMIKSSTIPQITRALRRMLQIDEPADISAINDLNLFAYGDSEDEMEALEEARLAVEQIVIPKSQPVELLPRSSTIRRMQHELVEHYHLKSTSFGTEPNRRLRIFPD